MNIPQFTKDIAATLWAPKRLNNNEAATALFNGLRVNQYAKLFRIFVCASFHSGAFASSIIRRGNKEVSRVGKSPGHSA
jgi:hypothetical protein